MRWRWLLLALLLSLLPSAALAHVPEGGAGSVMAGLLHPVTGIDHVVAMVAVGLWGAVLGAPAIWLLSERDGPSLAGDRSALAGAALRLNQFILSSSRSIPASDRPERNEPSAPTMPQRG